MEFEDIVKIVDQVKGLEDRLAVVEAEREKYQGLADNRLNCMALYRDLIGKHEARIGVLADKLNLAGAERDAARAGEARAAEALDVFARAYRVSMLPFAPGIDEADGAYHWMPHGWPSVADFKLANSVLSDSSALDWLAQQRREAAAEALDEAQKRERERRAELLEFMANRFEEKIRYQLPLGYAVTELRREAAALRAGATGGVDAG